MKKRNNAEDWRAQRNKQLGGRNGLAFFQVVFA
jgi:hypothetical protein